MTLPSFLFVSVLGLFLGSVYHLVRNGGFMRLLVFLFCGWVGIWWGHLLADYLDIKFLLVGPFALGPGLISLVVTLGLGDWLTLIRKKEDQPSG